MSSSKKKTQNQIDSSQNDDDIQVVEIRPATSATWQDNNNSARERSPQREPTAAMSFDAAELGDVLKQMNRMIRGCVDSQEQTLELTRNFSKAMEIMCGKYVGPIDNSPRVNNSPPLMIQFKGETSGRENPDENASVSDMALETPLTNNGQPLPGTPPGSKAHTEPHTPADNSAPAMQVAAPTTVVGEPAKVPRYVHPHNRDNPAISRSNPVEYSTGRLDRGPDSKVPTRQERLAALDKEREKLLEELSDVESPVLNFKLPKVEQPEIASFFTTMETNPVVKPPPDQQEVVTIEPAPPDVERQRVWTDRVAFQRLRNSDLRRTGELTIPNQGVGSPVAVRTIE